MKKNLLLIVLGTVMSLGSSFGQGQGELTLSAGSGYSFGLKLTEGIIDGVLEANNVAKTKKVPILNFEADYGISESFSLGFAYGYSNMTSSGNYQDTASVTHTYNAKLARQTFCGQGMFHLGSSEETDVYIGARAGYLVWSGDLTSTDPDFWDQESRDQNISRTTVALLFGVKHYFNDVVGIKFDALVGTGPYFLGGGLVFKL